MRPFPTLTALILSLLATLVVPAAASARGAPPTYVLVHGAWMGKSAWDPVAKRLRAGGAEVIQVELPAHGRDTTPAEKASLAGYVDAVAAAIGERKDVVLVGHSFGGIVISGVAEKIPQRVGRLVYVAAYLPKSGESAYSLSQQDKESRVGKYWTQADPAKYTPVTIRREGIADVFCNGCDAKTTRFVVDSHREEPVPPMGTPVTLTDARFGAVPRYYVATTQDHAVGYALQQAMLASTPVKQVVTLDTGHVPMLTAPARVADVLRAFARDGRSNAASGRTTSMRMPTVPAAPAVATGG
jgi:pimeloyl-ACP methyl ester carboxylesterase